MFVTNRLPEATSIHWHGQRLPNGMDGVSGLNQPSIKPGQTSCTSSVRSAQEPSCITRTRMRPRRWRWA